MSSVTVWQAFFQTKVPFTIEAKMEQSELADIKSELLKGNNRCLEIIFREEADFCIQNLVKSTTCPKDEAEDIFVESVLNFREKLIAGQVTYMNSIRNYLYTTCRNMWSERVRQLALSRKKRDTVRAYIYDEYGDDPLVSQDELEQKEALLQLTKKAMGQLNENCQEIIHYFYVEQYSMKDIVTLMGLSGPEVVKTMKYRCFKKLKEIALNFQNVGK